MRVLVVDDEKGIRELLKTTFESEAFVVDTAEDGERGSYLARTNDYDAIVLDHIMPKKDGLRVCKEIREAGRETPILMLSVRSSIDDRASHLENGADDYLVKPYSHRELVARLKAITRRGKSISHGILTIRSLTLDCDAQEVICGNNHIHLTRKEFGLLELLIKYKGRVVSRGMIMEHIWNMDSDPFSKTIETHIVNLRRKIGDKDNRIIINVSGRGYKIKE